MIYVRKSCGAVFEGSKKHDPLGSIQHHAKSATCAKAIHAEHLGELRERGVRHKKGSATSSFHNSAATNTLYAVTDPQGTVHAMVDARGTVTVSYTYDSWGNLLSASGCDSLIASLRFTWQGREYSHAAGLYNFRARWYDPAAGRWLSKDPIGLEGGLNLYEAFGNNPINQNDPLGLWGVQFGDTLIGSGTPWMEFDRDSWGDMGRGVVAWVDGVIYFDDPFAFLYKDENGCVAFEYRASRVIGGVTRDLMLALLFRKMDISTWSKDPLLYEIGSTTVSAEKWNLIKDLDVISRGRYLLNEANGNYLKAMLQGFGSSNQFLITIPTGATPGAAIGVTTLGVADRVK
ncbi:MAG: RHS repeat-associated core domain-containing protein [Kiritimatiellae bacterium]|nr:RHS repeat-associated core domain-containing protein [Kiritimatiellia bacterium]